MLRSIAINSATFKNCTLEEALKHIADAGYSFVELASMQGWCEHVNPYMSEHELDNVRRLLEKYGLTLSALAAHINFLESMKAEAQLISNICLARELGCKYVITSAGEGADEARIQALKRLDEVCADNGCILALEPHGACATGEILKRVIDDAATNNIVINFDTANVLFFGGADPLSDLESCVSRVGYVHLKDKRGGMGVWDFPAVGEGELPIKRVIEALDKAGYSGFLSVEIEFTPEGVSLAEITRSAKAALDNLNDML